MAKTNLMRLSQEKRLRLLVQTRNKKMARSAHAYVRGNTVKFYEWLDRAAPNSLPEGPPVWICGDCHVGNLGPLADKGGRVAIQIRDLDQTVIGNPAHDLIRLGLSLATAARGSDLPGVTTAHMVEQMVSGYAEALVNAVSKTTVAQRRDEAVGRVMRRAMNRQWKHLAEERIKNVRPTIPLGDHFWALQANERKQIEALIQTEPMRNLITGLQARKTGARVELLDAAYWVKGCSSLGRLRYAVLVGIGKRKANESDICFLDFKEAINAAAPRAKNAAMPKDNAQRVVTGAKALSPNLGGRMLAARLGDKQIVVRELMPQDLKLEIDQLTRSEAMNVARYLSGVVGHAHARQMDDATRKSWHQELHKHRGKGIDAPSWLWSSVVELVASHEAAYLEHCRKYALAA
jgi:uncharacterized protein (DUF2252 family)